MKLYDVPRNTVVRLVGDETPPPGGLPAKPGQLIDFHHIDGMYSFCHDHNGNVVHIKAWTEVEPIGPIHDPRN